MSSKSNGTGASSQPRKRLTKKLQYTQTVKLNNSTSEYSYYSKYLRPDITKAIGAQAQFAAYELWRLKKLRVYVQMAQNSDAVGASSNPAFNYATSQVIWTAADWGANESISGTTIMQYQNAKKNTPSLNKWTKVVDTTCRVNAKLNSSQDYNFIMPSNTMLNTTYFSSEDYSGYQLFIQSFGTQNLSVGYQPAFSIITEMEVEFMQPAFQNLASTFVANAFSIRMVTQPNSSDPTEKRTYIFDKITVSTNDVTDEREMQIRLIREDGESGSLTFTSQQLREAIASGTSGSYFGGRPITYDGPFPTRQIPDEDFQFTTEMS